MSGPNTTGSDRDFALAGRVALVTGGARGIGAAIARRFVRSGARVAITRLDDAVSAAAAAALEAELGAAALLGVVADAADEDATAAAFAATSAHFGAAPDTLVVNAADVSKAPWQEIGVAAWDDMMAVNLRGAYIAARAAVPAMRAAGYGKILTIGSVMAHIGDPRALHYVTTKHGLIGFTRSLARAEGASGIRVNCVVPGAIASERHFEEGGKAELGRLSSLQALSVRGWPDDIAAACQFMASRAGDFITAQVLTVDGGWSNY
ncbi:MAG: SDR family oxidoreductase [Rhodobacteraceae bacterium]|jgi:3-oxoacyl-[acyl-carrier protein] reductase|nr:SDR family oxidoreductase [Paracoccaceae bacterium]